MFDDGMEYISFLESKKTRLEISSITQTESFGYQNNQMLS